MEPYSRFPWALMKRNDLSDREKILLALIASFQEMNGAYSRTTTELAKRIGSGRTRTATMLASLKERGWIKLNYAKGVRQIRVTAKSRRECGLAVTRCSNRERGVSQSGTQYSNGISNEDRILHVSEAFMDSAIGD